MTCAERPDAAFHMLMPRRSPRAALLSLVDARSKNCSPASAYFAPKAPMQWRHDELALLSIRRYKNIVSAQRRVIRQSSSPARRSGAGAGLNGCHRLRHGHKMSGKPSRRRCRLGHQAEAYRRGQVAWPLSPAPANVATKLFCADIAVSCRRRQRTS